MPIKVTFKEKFPQELIRETPRFGFLGLCNKCEATEDPKVLLLWPTKHEYVTLVLQLKEMEREGGLTFEEQ